MKLKEMSIEELELLSYPKIAELYLKENKTTMSTAELFKEICKLLGHSESEYESKITDFFEALTTSKDFILLDTGHWDLKQNHKVKIDIDDIYEDEEIEVENEDEESTEELTGENIYESIDDDENYIDDDDDELSELTVIDEDAIDEEL